MREKLSKEELDEYNELLGIRFITGKDLTEEQQKRLEELFEKLDYPKMPNLNND